MCCPYDGGPSSHSIDCRLAVHPVDNVLASGQRGLHPHINIWDTRTMATFATLTGFHHRRVVSLSFSPCGSRLVTISADDKQSIAVYQFQQFHGVGDTTVNYAEAVLLFNAVSRCERVLDCLYHPFRGDGEFVVAGEKHVRFWSDPIGTAGRFAREGMGVT